MSNDSAIVLTADGLARLERELDRLRTVQRREVAERIRESKQFGEFAENAEYEEAKTEQAFVEGRILELQRVLQQARVLNETDIPTDRVGIGSCVTVRDEDADELWDITLVGSLESDPDQDRISDESPVGRALLGKQVGDVVQVSVPDGRALYRVERIGR
ncbi:MAG: transcription elongation factor GreA [Armatimonadetes bacterium]|nr:transcription elongation factor GreA [Armatimonadota bacterium]